MSLFEGIAILARESLFNASMIAQWPNHKYMQRLEQVIPKINCNAARDPLQDNPPGAISLDDLLSKDLASTGCDLCLC